MLKHPASIKVGTNISRISKRSFDIKQAIFANDVDEPILVAVSVGVMFDY
jgi:acyl-CoA thioesterase FadM